jgi:hypothetical protein
MTVFFCRFLSLFALIIALSNCSASQDSPLDAAGVCRLIADIDVTTITSSEMADQAFDHFALELQDANVRSEVKEVFNLLIGADAKDTYQLYLEAGEAYKEDWSCSPMKDLLSIK